MFAESSAQGADGFTIQHNVSIPAGPDRFGLNTSATSIGLHGNAQSSANWQFSNTATQATWAGSQSVSVDTFSGYDIERQHRARKATSTEPGKGASKPRVVMQRTGHGPVKIGGTALAVSVGLRREYGLRQLGVASPAQA